MWGGGVKEGRWRERVKVRGKGEKGETEEGEKGSQSVKQLRHTITRRHAAVGGARGTGHGASA